MKKILLLYHIFLTFIIDSTLTVLEAITTANGVLAGLLLVALTSPLDTIRRQRDELLLCYIEQ
jgi:hypothetical protein